MESALSRSVSLRDVLPGSTFLREGDVQITSATSDWRDCRAGELFVAITTADDDGHEHACQAVARGAKAVLAERLLPVDVPLVIVPDTREAYSRLCQAIAGHPCRRMRTIGVTGTAGKSVTAILLASILEKAGDAVGVISSIGYSDSLTQTTSKPHTPATEDFAEWLGRAAIAGCQSAVVELSSTALAERRATGMELDAVVLTNIRRDHLELHNTQPAYQKAKRRAFSLLKNGGVSVLNADDHRSRNLLAELDTPNLTYGLHAEADIAANVVERHLSEQLFILNAGHESVPVRTRMIGDHHVSNCLAAATACLALGIDLQTIARGLEAVTHVPGRLERLECGQPFGVFVDAAQSPETLALSMKTVRQVTRGRVYVIAGCEGGRDKTIRPLMGRVLERGAQVPIITSNDPRHEEPLEIAHAMLDGFERPHKAHIIPDRAEAIRWALSEAREGDSVLITGKGDRVGQVTGRRRLAHDDREIACEWLYSRADDEPVHPRFRVVG